MFVFDSYQTLHRQRVLQSKHREPLHGSPSIQMHKFKHRAEGLKTTVAL